MTEENDRTRTNIQNLNKKKIIHAKVVLALISVYIIIEAAGNIYTILYDSLLPKKYIYYFLPYAIVLSLPGILCFKFPKFAFISGGIISLLVILNSFLNSNLFGFFISLYVIGAIALGYFALIKEEKLNPKRIEYPDILDHE